MLLRLFRGWFGRPKVKPKTLDECRQAVKTRNAEWGACWAKKKMQQRKPDVGMTTQEDLDKYRAEREHRLAVKDV